MRTYNSYVYRHIRIDTNEVFYVGIGTNGGYYKKDFYRAFAKNNRNTHWKNIVSKTGYSVEIIAEGLSWEDACKKEVEFISIYGRKDLNKGSLVNLTDGGDGVLNQIHSEKRRKIVSEKMKKRVFSVEHRQNLSSALIGNQRAKGRKLSHESIKKISAANKGKSNFLGKKHTPETIEKMRKARTGYKQTEETKEKLRNKVISEETREKMRIASRNRKDRNPCKSTQQ